MNRLDGFTVRNTVDLQSIPIDLMGEIHVNRSMRLCEFLYKNSTIALYGAVQKCLSSQNGDSFERLLGVPLFRRDFRELGCRMA